MDVFDIDKEFDELFQKIFLRSEEDKAKYERINKEIRDQTEFLWADFSPMTSKYRVFFRERNDIASALRKPFTMMKMFLEIEMVSSKSKITKTLTEVLEYLTSIETNGVFAVNVMLLLLTANGDYIHLQPDRDHWYIRHATRLKELQNPNLPLGTKIDFLVSHGLVFFRNWINKTLRNDIAHANFDIDAEGTFFIVREKQDGTKTRTPFDISNELRSFQMYSNAFNSMVMEKTSKRK